MSSTDVTFDDDLDIQDKDLKPRKKAYEVNHTVHTPDEIRRHQDAQINEVSTILDQPPENTAILLRHARWNKEKLIESYMEKEDEILEAAGLGKSDKGPRQLKQVPGFVCDICCEVCSKKPGCTAKHGHLAFLLFSIQLTLVYALLTCIIIG